MDTRDIICRDMDREEWDALLQNRIRWYRTMPNRELRKLAAEDFVAYCFYIRPEIIWGRHLEDICNAVMRMEAGDHHGLGLSVAPRHSKTFIVGEAFPSWLIGRKPSTKIIQVSHSAGLAKRSGQTVRDIVNSDAFRDVFPHVTLDPSSQAKDVWQIHDASNPYAIVGRYVSSSIGGNITGEGADYFLVDDPHNEQEALSQNPKIYDKAFDWYTSACEQRLQPQGKIIIIATRWSEKDLLGRIKRAEADKLSSQRNKWEYLEFPAITKGFKTYVEIEELYDTRHPRDSLAFEQPYIDWVRDDVEVLWEEFRPKDEIIKTMMTLEPHPRKFIAQYQQNPSGYMDDCAMDADSVLMVPADAELFAERDDGGYRYKNSLITVFQSWDTAYSEKDTSDFSAITTWGVYHADAPFLERIHDGESLRPMHFLSGERVMVLLDAFRYKVKFSELVSIAAEKAEDFKARNVFIEARGSGTPLASMLMVDDKLGTLVHEWQPKGDKVERASACDNLLTSGVILRYEACPEWEDIYDEMSKFPNGIYDDYVDSITQAILIGKQRYGVGRKTYAGHDPFKKPTVTKERTYREMPRRSGGIGAYMPKR